MSISEHKRTSSEVKFMPCSCILRVSFRIHPKQPSHYLKAEKRRSRGVICKGVQGLMPKKDVLCYKSFASTLILCNILYMAGHLSSAIVRISCSFCLSTFLL